MGSKQGALHIQKIFIATQGGQVLPFPRSYIKHSVDIQCLILSNILMSYGSTIVKNLQTVYQFLSKKLARIAKKFQFKGLPYTKWQHCLLDNSSTMMVYLHLLIERKTGV